MTKRQYTTPTIHAHGAMTAITKQNQSGTFIDFSFSAGTPVSQLTLS